MDDCIWSIDIIFLLKCVLAIGVTVPLRCVCKEQREDDKRCDVVMAGMDAHEWCEETGDAVATAFRRLELL